jgi:hypothetical protein
MLPGPVQRPRPPFYIAATGTRGLDLAARFAQGWVTTGHDASSVATCEQNVTRQLERLGDALRRHSRHVNDVATLLLDGLNNERPLVSLDAFVDWAGRYRTLGITELVIHWPEPDSLFDSSIATFEKIALEGLRQLGEQP